MTTGPNATEVEECALSSSPASYFWYRNAIDSSSSLGDINGINLHMAGCLLVAWTVVYLCVMKGIKTSGKVRSLCSLRRMPRRR